MCTLSHMPVLPQHKKGSTHRHTQSSCIVNNPLQGFKNPSSSNSTSSLFLSLSSCIEQTKIMSHTIAKYNYHFKTVLNLKSINSYKISWI